MSSASDRSCPFAGVAHWDLMNTFASDNSYETITEEPVNINPDLLYEDFAGAFPPAGWAEQDPTGNWNQLNANNCGGDPPEAYFNWVASVNTWRLYAGPIDTSGYSAVDLSWLNLYDDYAAGVTVKVETSNNGATWQDSGWQIVSGGGNQVGPEFYTITTSDVGSSTFYFSFTVDGDAYQLDAWLVDNVRLQKTDVASVAEHKWTTYVKGGETDYEFNLEASRSDATDDFVFAYSTDDVSYNNMVTVNSGTDTTYTYTLPPVSGTLYIRALDTDRAANEPP